MWACCGSTFQPTFTKQESIKQWCEDLSWMFAWDQLTEWMWQRRDTHVVMLWCALYACPKGRSTFQWRSLPSITSKKTSCASAFNRCVCQQWLPGTLCRSPRRPVECDHWPFSSRPTIATSQPATVSVWAIVAPIPLEPPVTSARLPWSDTATASLIIATAAPWTPMSKF